MTAMKIGETIHTKEEVDDASRTLRDLAEVDGRRRVPPFTRAHDIKGAEPFIVLSHNKTKFRVFPIYFRGLPHEGKETRVFAWLSVPISREDEDDEDAQKEEDSEEETFPGVVLVHGGGGTAFREWCEMWAERGFASIAIAVEGQSDVKRDEKHPETKMFYERLEEHFPDAGDDRHLSGVPGPFRQGRAYSDYELPLKEQWLFHATADALLAAQLLRSRRHVRPDHVGILGVSWGGAIVCTAIGFDASPTVEAHGTISDNLFAFAMMAYGCGSMSDSLSHVGKQIRMRKRGENNPRKSSKYVYDHFWDPVLRLKDVTLPTMWISWPGEYHFPLPDQAVNYRTVGSGKKNEKGDDNDQDHSQPNCVTLIIPNLGHGHQPIYKTKECYEFAKCVVGANPYEEVYDSGSPAGWVQEVNIPDEDDILHLVEQAKADGSEIFPFQTEFELVSSKEIEKALVVFTKTPIQTITSEAKWEEEQDGLNVECVDDGAHGRRLWRVSAEVDSSATSWYVHLHTNDKLSFSSRFHQISLAEVSN